MASLPPRDLTRWNRAGLARVQYVDGNAAVFLERLRQRLSDRYPDWKVVQSTLAPAADEAQVNAYLEDQYAFDPDDLLWHLTRSTARAAHILAATLDAYANEGWIGTATQWESLRRLVAMLDYAPHPAASAYAPVALLLKDNASGVVNAGLQFRYTPTDGRAPLLFETLEAIDADAARNAMRCVQYNQNPAPLYGTTVVLEGRQDKLTVNDPLVLEDEPSGTLSAHVVAGYSLGIDGDGNDITTVTLAPSLARSVGLTIGSTLVHALPKDKLAPIGPLATQADIDYALELDGAASDLAAGDIVTIGRVGAKPAYRRIKRVDERRLVFHRRVGPVDVENATIARPTIVPIVRREGARSSAGGRTLQALLVAGDLRSLQSQWLADIRVIDGKEYLPVYECIRAEYTPVTQGTSEKEGFTTITLAWNPVTDREIGSAGGEPQLNLSNPQSLLAPSQAAGPWRPDRFLASTSGRLDEPIVTALPKKTSAGDIAVIQRGRQLAWARLSSVAIDSEASQGRLASERGFDDRGGGPYFVGTTRVRSHFSAQVRLSGWLRNTTPIIGARVELDALPASARVGQSVIADNGTAAVATRIGSVNAGAKPPYVELRDVVPSGSTHENLVLYGNVALTGHGATKPTRNLGSGDATRSHQQFVLDVTDLSFVADATMPAGVRAAVEVTVGAETWTQVANLNDSGPTDAYYQVRQREDGSALIEFGDGARGRRLPTGASNVRVTYRQGSGSGGNLSPRSLAALARPDLRVRAAVQPIAASGGAERESSDAIRTNAAATLLALDRAVSLEDFSHLARSQAAVVQAQAFAQLPGRGQRENIEVRVIPAGGGTYTDELGGQIEAFLLAHALPGVGVTVCAYVALPIAFDVKVRVRFDAFDRDQVIDRVRVALIAGFGIERRALGQPLFTGEVIAIVEAVEGVENSDCDIRIDAATAAMAHRVVRDADGGVIAVRPEPSQCVHVDANRPDVNVVAEAFSL